MNINVNTAVAALNEYQSYGYATQPNQVLFEALEACVGVLNNIHQLMDGTEWGADTNSYVAAELTDFGYTIRDSDDCDDE